MSTGVTRGWMRGLDGESLITGKPTSLGLARGRVQRSGMVTRAGGSRTWTTSTTRYRFPKERSRRKCHKTWAWGTHPSRGHPARRPESRSEAQAAGTGRVAGHGATPGARGAAHSRGGGPSFNTFLTKGSLSLRFLPRKRRRSRLSGSPWKVLLCGCSCSVWGIPTWRFSRTS